MSRLFHSIWTYVRVHKFAVVIVVFLFVILFADQNSMIKRYAQKRQINALEKEIDMYRSQIEEDAALLDNIEHDSVLLERMARKNYNMSRQDEDVFIME